jgi:hypothetical protein
MMIKAIDEISFPTLKNMFHFTLSITNIGSMYGG